MSRQAMSPRDAARKAMGAFFTFWGDVEPLKLFRGLKMVD